ncbi:chromate transporter [Sabulicella rubraurantiaca]|uniref:chromate transporter n=1 Tax=Sabulicella rubraurantiaca TaxID=2811429 RepID=UPI001A96DAA3|nr:chromate transporter [Sabulicella rubraurantiaca]
MILQLFLTFSLLSLLAIGGANAVLPEMYRQIVEIRGWIEPATFAQLFALAQAAPGPNILAASVMGWRIAGPVGLGAATLGMLLPAAILAWCVAGVTQRLSRAPWLRPAQFGLVPVAIGLIAASGVIMAEAAGTGPLPWVIILGSALFVWRTAFSPLWALAAGGVLGWFLL